MSKTTCIKAASLSAFSVASNIGSDQCQVITLLLPTALALGERCVLAFGCTDAVAHGATTVSSVCAPRARVLWRLKPLENELKVQG